jgi:hypothetical protein
MGDERNRISNAGSPNPIQTKASQETPGTNNGGKDGNHEDLLPGPGRNQGSGKEMVKTSKGEITPNTRPSKRIGAIKEGIRKR